VAGVESPCAPARQIALATEERKPSTVATTTAVTSRWVGRWLVLGSRTRRRDKIERIDDADYVTCHAADAFAYLAMMCDSSAPNF
jgi:hypothetical protein